MKRTATSTPAKKPKAAPPPSQSRASASRLIDARIKELGDWRGKTLAHMRTLIKRACPDVVEEWKWDVPVWSRADGGIICTGESYKSAVKLTFAKGASLPDPSRLFNASLEGSTRRAIDLHAGDVIDEVAFQALILAAAAPQAKAGKSRAAKSSGGKIAPRLLSGGNPQISKGEGDATVQAYIAAMPGWKRAVGKRLDALIERAVPGVRKAVKWNSPLYGAAGQDTTGKTGSWFLGVHCFEKYIKIAFFRGTALSPLPPEKSKQKDVRYFHIHEGDALDEARFADWVKQASRVPGERM